jgi:hypothetical protein
VRTYQIRIDGEIVTLEENSKMEARITVGRVTIYGQTPLIAMEGVVELLSPERAA